MYAVKHNFVDMRATFFHMLKIASDGNFYLLFGENYNILAFSKLQSAKFDPCNGRTNLATKHECECY